jgi:hypothetical protein
MVFIVLLPEDSEHRWHVGLDRRADARLRVSKFHNLREGELLEGSAGLSAKLFWPTQANAACGRPRGPRPIERP